VFFWKNIQHVGGEEWRWLLGCKRRDFPSQRKLSELCCSIIINTYVIKLMNKACFRNI
jgi:hypothetical protein